VVGTVKLVPVVDDENELVLVPVVNVGVELVGVVLV
jgi:hypothetical protein